MSVANQVTLTHEGITYVLAKHFEQIDANGTLSKKATYTLTQSSSLHGASREAVICLLELKFGLREAIAAQIVDHLDNAAEEERIVRKTTDAPSIIGGGIPTRPLATVN